MNRPLSTKARGKTSPTLMISSNMQQQPDGHRVQAMRSAPAEASSRSAMPQAAESRPGICAGAAEPAHHIAYDATAIAYGDDDQRQLDGEARPCRARCTTTRKRDHIDRRGGQDVRTADRRAIRSARAGCTTDDVLVSAPYGAVGLGLPQIIQKNANHSDAGDRPAPTGIARSSTSGDRPRPSRSDDHHAERGRKHRKAAVQPRQQRQRRAGRDQASRCHFAPSPPLKLGDRSAATAATRRRRRLPMISG